MKTKSTLFFLKSISGLASSSRREDFTGRSYFPVPLFDVGDVEKIMSEA